jgi:hypothetical protein
LGNHMIRSHRRQNPKGLLVLLLQLFPRSLGLSQRGRSHRDGSHLKSIMFQDAGGRLGERQFAAKVDERPLQSLGPSSGRCPSRWGSGRK